MALSRCSVCDKVTEVIQHIFYEGSPQKPMRQWMIIAPLYFKDDKSFCSPECSLKGYTSEKPL